MPSSPDFDQPLHHPDLLPESGAIPPSETFNHQLETQPPNTLDSLKPELVLQCKAIKDIKQERFRQAEITSSKDIIARLNSFGFNDFRPFSIDKLIINDPHPKKLTGFDYGHILELQEFGVNPSELLASFEHAQPNQLVCKVPIEQDTIEIIKTDKNGIYISLTRPTNDQSPNQTSDAIVERVKQRYFNSPPYQAIEQLRQQITAAQAVPPFVRTKDIDIEADPLGTLCLWRSLGFTSYIAINSEVVKDQQSILDNLDNIANEYRTDFNNQDSMILINRSSHITTTLTINKQTNSFNISLSADLRAFYNEGAYIGMPESPPFIDTRCAAELIYLLDNHGLKLNQDMVNELTRIGRADQYGSPYTQLSREIAKWVNRPQRFKPSNVFELKDVTSSQSENQDLVKAISDRLMAIDTTEASLPTQLLFSLSQDCILRHFGQPAHIDHPKTLPGTAMDTSIRANACFDVASSYIDAPIGYLQPYMENDVAMIEKWHKAHSFLLTEPAVLNNIMLPPGSLLQKNDQDQGWAMLRLTPFCFENEEDIAATGSEMPAALRANDYKYIPLNKVRMVDLIEAAQNVDPSLYYNQE